MTNVRSILASGGLWCDAQLMARGGPTTSIGMGNITQRRLGLPVKCYPGDFVGGYVPFYFCPRSIMLFLIYRANHAEMSYQGGQDPILHLELDMHEVIDWAGRQPQRWAFTLSNAGATYSEFRSRIEDLAQINWLAVAATDFRDSATKEGKQAEFLVERFVPWTLVRRVGCRTAEAQEEALRTIAGAAHQPPVEIRRSWYF